MFPIIRLKTRPVEKAHPITAEVGQINGGLWQDGHKGTDFGAVRDANGGVITPILGEAVVSALSGKVQLAGWQYIVDPESGKEIQGPLGVRIWIVSEVPDFGVIRCGYCHLDRTYVREGQDIAEGQEIGKAGNTGHVTAAHLHFQIEQWPSRQILKPVFDEVA